MIPHDCMTATCAKPTVSQAQPCDVAALSNAARRRLVDRAGEPMFICRWVDVVFLHYEVAPDALRGLIPFELDLFRGSRLCQPPSHSRSEA